MSSMIVTGIIFFSTCMLFLFLCRKLWKSCGAVCSIATAAYWVFNMWFLVQMPFYSDDIYNHAVSADVMNNLWSSLFESYHYARFPLNAYVIMSSLYHWFSFPSLPHAFLILTHLVSLLVFAHLLKRFLLWPKLLILAFLLLTISLPSNVENLLWFSALHENLSLMFTSLSVWSLVKVFDHRNEHKKLWYFAGAILLQLLAVASSEVGYVLLATHGVFLLLRTTSNGRSKTALELIRAGVVLSAVSAILIGYRYGVISMLEQSVFSSPYQGESLNTFLVLLFSTKIFAYLLTPLAAAKQLPWLIISLGLISSAINLRFFKMEKLDSKSLTTTGVAVVGFGGIAVLLAVLHAIVSVPLQYNFPRFSYLTGIFLVCAVLAATQLLAKLMHRANWLTQALKVTILLFVSIYMWWWTERVLLRVPTTKTYIQNFELNLSSIIKSEIKPNTFVLFSFTSVPDSNIVAGIRQYDLLQWNHAIVGYFLSESGASTLSSVFPMPLDHQDANSLNYLHLTLTGSYWQKYGNDANSILNLLDDLNIEHIQHYHFDGLAITSPPVQKILLYDTDFTATMSGYLQ